MTHEDSFFPASKEEDHNTPSAMADEIDSGSISLSPDEVLTTTEAPSATEMFLDIEPVEEDSSVGNTEVPDAGSTLAEARQFRALGIRFRKAGQVYFFPDETHTVRVGSKVVTELEQGPALGQVEAIQFSSAPWEVDEESPAALGRIVGLATAQDIAQHAENSILSAEASAFCKTCIRQRKLDMKLVDVEVLHDRSKIIFFFTAPSRIDFRELVKDLVRNYRTRIELRQIGVRHETQMVGGIGNCGMVCCCHKYLRKFAPVTIKMAKEQNLFLNPAKLSGMCGRLLCCLSFEQGNYEEFNRRCPKIGKKYNTAKGNVKVVRANMFSQSIVVYTDAGEEQEMTLEEWDAMAPRRADPPAPDQQRAAALRSGYDHQKKGRSRESDKVSQEYGSLPDEAASGSQEAKRPQGNRHEPGERTTRPRKRRRPQEN